MTFSRFVALSIALSVAIASSAVACAGTQGTHSDSGAPEAGADVRRDVRPKDAPTERDSQDASDAGVDGAPFLTALALSGSGDAAAGLALVPPFSPTIYDYYVRCGRSMDVSVAMTASRGADSQLIQPITSARKRSQTVVATAKENDALVAVAIEGSLSTEYWVRCLPQDFPKIRMQAHPENGTPPPGYYLVGNYLTKNAGGYAMVLDGNGVPVWYHLNSETVGVCNVDSLEEGGISYVPALGKAEELLQLAPWSVSTLTTPLLDEHELRRLPNGDYLVITHPLLTGVDMTGVTLSYYDGGGVPLGPNTQVLDCHIEELAPDGSVVWTWKGSHHVDPGKDIEYAHAVGENDAGFIVDAFHCNSIDVDPTSPAGNLLVSACHMNSVLYVERPSGKVLWKLGGAKETLDKAVYIPVPGKPFIGQHDARFQADWTSCGQHGGISVFDDQFLEAGPARAVAYDLVTGVDAGAGGDCGPPAEGGVRATETWSKSGAMSSMYMGSYRVSPDGSRIIGWGTGNAPLAFTEVDADGHPLLEFYFDDGNITYRAVKVPLSQLDLDVLRTTTGRP